MRIFVAYNYSGDLIAEEDTLSALNKLLDRLGYRVGEYFIGQVTA